MVKSKSPIVSNANELHSIARKLTPKDKGPMRESVRLRTNGINKVEILYDPDNEIFYLDFNEYGTRFTTKNKGFIRDKTVRAILTYLERNKNRL